MELAGAGTFLSSIAEYILWLLILGAVLFVLFIAWLHKWENEREQRQRRRKNK